MQQRGASDRGPANTTHRARIGITAKGRKGCLATFYNRAVNSSYAGRKGFTSLEAWAAACHISKAIPILVVYDKEHTRGIQPTVSWVGANLVITYGKVVRTKIAFHGIQLTMHELAHVWDGAQHWELGAAMATLVQNPADYPTAKARDEGWRIILRRP